MGRRMLFIENILQGKMVEIGNQTFAYYDGDILEITRYGAKVFAEKVSSNEGYEVICAPYDTKVRKLSPPEEKVHVLRWLCGVPMDAFCTSESQYKKNIQKYFCRNKKLPIHTWKNEGSSYKIFWSQKFQENARPYCVACFISEAISTEEILEMIPVMQKAGYPDDYIQHILGVQFGVKAQKFKECLSKN